MAKLILDKNNMVSFPTLLLQNKNFDTLGCIADYYDFTYSEHFNGANECSFTVYKKLDNVENALWDSIVDFKVLYIPEYQERFEIKVSESYEGSDTKNITATSLCEAELGQTILRNIEINTETDISNVNYDENFPTVFFRNVDDYMAYDWSGSKYSDYSDKKKQEVLRNSSLLHRLLEKAPHYSIGHIDQSLINIQRTFSISNTDIYGELTGEIAEEFGCLFVFDSMTRTISAYDLYYTCATCGHRGDFSDKCSKCGSEDLYGQYGEDTTVFIDRENLANNISIETNSDSLKNCFYVEGGDELVNATIRMINPNGSQYIFYFSEETKKDMPTELVNILEQYEDEYSSIINNMNIALTSDISIINNYNIVVNCINTLFPEKKYDEITQFLVGYSSISKFIFEATDLYMFVKTSMMPTIEIDNMDIKSSMLNIVNGFATGFNVDLVTGSEYIFQNTIAITNPTSAIQSIVERRVLNTAKLYYNTALYNLDLECINYTQATTETDGSYTCKFILTSIADKDDNGLPLEEISEEITLSISDDVLLYTEQEIIVATADKDSIKDNQITSLSMSLDKFTERIKLYSLDELSNLLTMFESCLSIIEDKELKDNELYMVDDLYGKYRSFYYDRILIVNQRLAKLEEYLGYIKNVYYYDSSNGETSGVLNNIRNVICDMLDIKSYLGDDLYNTFCSYRREDTYSNSNYISDGLNDAELLEKTEKLLDVAKKELYKAGSLQYSVSSDINNFLALPEFEPFKSKFEVGNWIRIGIDDKIYKLRLLSYEVKYEDIQTISLEFSTVEKIYNGTTDINSIMSSASSMATSYSSVVKQVEKDSEKTKMVDGWINEGLMATQTKFVNAKNQCLTIDENGLLARSYDSIHDIYSPFQLKIVNNGLYTTHNAWETIDVGVGRISYYDPILKENVEDYGIIAKTIVGHLILGENLVIANSNDDGLSTVKIDKDGIYISGGELCIGDENDTSKPYAKITSDGVLYARDGVFTGEIKGGTIDINGKFKVDKDGNVTLPVGTKISWEDVNEITENVTTITNETISTTDVLAENLQVKAAHIQGQLAAEQIDTKGLIAENISSTTIDGKTISGGNIINEYNDYITEIKNGQIYSHTISLKQVDSGLVPAIYLENLEGTAKVNSILFEEDLIKFGSAIECGEITSSSSVWIKESFHVEGDNNGLRSEHGWLIRNNNVSDETIVAVGSTLLDTRIYGTNIYQGGSSTTITSDERIKQDFNTLEQYEDLFFCLKPVSYKYKNGTSGRTHIGIVGQDVKEALHNNNLTTDDFAGYVEFPTDEECMPYIQDATMCGVRLDEFVMLNTHMIQKLYKVIENQKQEIDLLKEKLEGMS